jgi:hypothetical protein
VLLLHTSPAEFASSFLSFGGPLSPISPPKCSLMLFHHRICFLDDILQAPHNFVAAPLIVVWFVFGSVFALAHEVPS